MRGAGELVIGLLDSHTVSHGKACESLARCRRDDRSCARTWASMIGLLDSRTVSHRKACESLARCRRFYGNGLQIIQGDDRTCAHVGFELVIVIGDSYARVTIPAFYVPLSKLFHGGVVIGLLDSRTVSDGKARESLTGAGGMIDHARCR